MPDLSAKQIGAIDALMRRLCPMLGLALSEQLNVEATLELLEVRAVPLATLLARTEHVLQTQFAFSHPEGAESVFVVPEDTAHVFADLMEGMSGGETTEPLTDSQIDTISAGMNGVVRAFSIGLNDLTGDRYDLEAGSTHLGALTVPPVFALDGNAIEVRFSVSIPDVIDTELTGLFTTVLMADLAPVSEGAGLDGAATMSGGVMSNDDLTAMLGEVGRGGDEQGASTSSFGMDANSGSPFPELAGRNGDFMAPRGLEMILDIPLDVTVELGRVRMLIKDVLELSSGSIIELDRVAGEPVDLLVNGRLVAKGEVVVIEDNFGIRITEIVSPAERVAGLGRGDRR